MALQVHGSSGVAGSFAIAAIRFGSFPGGGGPRSFNRSCSYHLSRAFPYRHTFSFVRRYGLRHLLPIPAVTPKRTSKVSGRRAD